MTEYPTSLPLPDFGTYAGSIDQGLIRTNMPAASPSQIVGFNAPRTQITMTFSMVNDDFAEWEAWVLEFGYYWFTMPVVSGYEPVVITSTHKIRIISDIEYQKRGDNWLSVSVIAEIIQSDAEDPLAITTREYDFILAGTPSSPSTDFIDAGQNATPSTDGIIIPSIYGYRKV